MSNPNPYNITNELWQFWLDFKAYEPAVELGGIYANKKGYHNTRKANIANWPGNYSYAQFEIDRQGPDDKAAAIDLTFPNAQRGDYSTIAVYSSRLRAAGRANDPRTVYFREFYGQCDSDREVEGYDFTKERDASSDDSHLWHIHISIHRAYVGLAKAFRALMSILKGETVAQWLASEEGKPVDPPPPAPKLGDRMLSKGHEGADVWELQALLISRGYTLPRFGADGDFGDETDAAVRGFQRCTLGPSEVDGEVGPKTLGALRGSLRRAWPGLPSGHYFGLRTGPNESHGGGRSADVAHVKAIQARLNALGFNAGGVDGDFGPRTRAAVIAWQRARYAPAPARPGEIRADDWARLFTY